MPSLLSIRPFRLLRRRISRTDQPIVTRERTRCFAEMLLRPTWYTQRCFEQVAFVPTGGHRWLRTLQIRIPTTAQPVGLSWRIISLGVYSRRRFPDFAVLGADGDRVDLLTREQHGVALTQAALNRFIDRLPAIGFSRLNMPHVRTAYRDCWEVLYNFFTTAGDTPTMSRDTLAEHMTECYGALLASLTVSNEQLWLDRFADDIMEMIDSTRYLCWVQARPGEIVNLRVSYTTEDAKHELEYKDWRETLRQVNDGTVEPRYERRKIWAEWYRELGIAPLNYEFSVPSRNHASSYYFNIDAPAGSYVTYLDWETSNSSRDSELDCAFPSAHVHNDEEPGDAPSMRGRTIRAYVRCAPHHHKQIIGATLLNGVLIYVLIVGRLPERLGESAQSLLVAIPSILTAYLVEQQRHYHAHAMRRQRAVLWGYLAVSVTFLVTILFSRHQGTIGSRGLGLFASIVTWILGAASAGIFVWYLPQGHSFGRWTEWLTKRREHRVRTRLDREKEVLASMEGQYSPQWLELYEPYRQAQKSIERGEESSKPWRCYERAVHQYCSATFRSAIAAAVVTFVGIILAWHFPSSSHKLTDRPLHKGAAVLPVADPPCDGVMMMECLRCRTSTTMRAIG
jgi:hypothetical protein